MQDEQFGTLTWSYMDWWQGKTSFPAFQMLGRALHEKDPPNAATGTRARRSSARRNAEEDDQGAMWREGVCDLIIDTGGKPAKPSKAHRAAWQVLLARGDWLWDELFEKAYEIYRRQLPIRRRLWKAIYGDYLLDRRLPKVRKLADFKNLCCPWLFRIKPQRDPKASSADIGVHVLCTWHVDGFGAIIRDGHVAEIAPVLDVVHTEPQQRPTIEHPIFGTLSRIPDDDVWEFINAWEMPKEAGKSGFENAKRVATRPWQGLTRLDSLLDFARIVWEKAQFTCDRANADPPNSCMAWEFAGGLFDLRVYTPPGRGPSRAQANAFATFRAHEKQYAIEMISTIFKQYQATRDLLRKNYKDRDIDDAIPVITSPAGLRHLIQLRHIHVHPGNAKNRITIAFQFVASYDYDGFSVMWRNGKFVKWGKWNDAEHG